MIKKISLIVLIIAFILFGLGCSHVNADTYTNDNTNDYGLYNAVTGNTRLTKAGTLVAGWLRYGALVLAVGMLMVKGIKFIISAPEGKADVKKEMIPWAIGVFILFTFNLVVDVIMNIATGFNNSI